MRIKDSIIYKRCRELKTETMNFGAKLDSATKEKVRHQLEDFKAISSNDHEKFLRIILILHLDDDIWIRDFYSVKRIESDVETDLLTQFDESNVLVEFLIKQSLAIYLLPIARYGSVSENGLSEVAALVGVLFDDPKEVVIFAEGTITDPEPVITIGNMWIETPRET